MDENIEKQLRRILRGKRPKGPRPPEEDEVLAEMSNLSLEEVARLAAKALTRARMATLLAWEAVNLATSLAVAIDNKDLDEKASFQKITEMSRVYRRITLQEASKEFRRLYGFRVKKL